MKTKHLFYSILLMAIALTNTAQIKVFTGGNTIVGSTASPITGAKLQITGTTIFTTATGTVTPSFAAYIRSTNGASTATTPDYTWNTDNTTGIFHSTSGLIQFTISGGEKFRINASGQLLNTNTTSAASTPDFSWNGDANTGMFNAGADLLGFSTNGTERFRINNSFQLLNLNATSSVSTPEYSWSSDPNTGMYRPGADVLGFVANGSEKMRINSSGQILNSNSSSTVSTPDFSWNSDLNTGFYRPGNDIIGFVTNGSEKIRLSSAGNLHIGGTTDNTVRLEVTTGDFKAFRTNVTHSGDYGFAQISRVNRGLTKGLSVVNTAAGNDSVTFYVYGSGDAWGKSWTSWSDGRLKENVDTLQGALNKVLRLKGVKYNFKTEVTGLVNNKTEMGLIAQDVEQVVPEVVNTSDNGVKGIVYQNLVPLLIEAIKEQNKKIEKLETDLNQCCTKKTTSTTINNRSTSNTQTEATNVSETSNWLAQNKPNPFNKETVIEYNVVQEGKGSVLVFDMNGKLLKTIAIKIPGKGTVTITANDLPAGMYYYTLVVNDNEVDTKKMILTE